MKPQAKRQHRLSRHKRVRAKITGTSKRPRVAVFKSNQYVYTQVIDDKTGKTLASVSDYGGKKSKSKIKYYYSCAVEDYQLHHEVIYCFNINYSFLFYYVLMELFQKNVKLEVLDVFPQVQLLLTQL